MACRHLGLGYAAYHMATSLFSGGQVGVMPPNTGHSTATAQADGHSVVLAGVRCRGDEATLLDCHHDQTVWCPGAGAEEVAAVVCTDTQARHVMSSCVLCHVMYSCVMYHVPG